MKKNNHNYSANLFFTVIFLLIISNSICAQSTNQKSFWINVGIGEGSVEDFKGDMAANISATYQFSKNLFTLRYLTDGELFIGSGLEIYDYSLLYGRVLTSSTFLASFGIGLGLIDVNRKGGLFTETEKIGIKVGLPFETQLFWRPLRFLGIGVYGFANINSEESFYGYAVSIQIGKLR